MRRRKTLVAGFGNSLRGDDGFGVEILKRLSEMNPPPRPGVTLLEVGTGGIRMAQELLSGYDRLIVVDAMTRGGAPGTVYALAVDSVERATEVDMHVAVPASALSVAQALGALPAEVFMVGCEPADADELRLALSPPVRAAIAPAVEHVLALIVDHAPAPAPLEGSLHAG